MIVEIGAFSLALALALSVAQSLVGGSPVGGARR